MYILYELWKKKASEYISCTLSDSSVQLIRQSTTLGVILQQSLLSRESKQVLLLDEQRFIWRAMPVAFCATRPCTVQDMYATIEPLIASYGWQASEKMFYHVDAISINGKPSDFYIGKTGDIRCIVHVIMLHREDRYEAKRVVGSNFDGMHVYPASFFTLHHIKQTLGKKQWTLLYIGQHYTKRITFAQGMYISCEFLDLGRQVLKDIYAENNIREFFSTNGDVINEYAEGIIIQSVQFYVDMLIRRLASQNTQGDIFLVSELIQNTYFMEAFTEAYRSIATGYIVPVGHVKGVKTFGKNWSSEELDMQTAATYFV
jgi:hypothetical protein